MARLPILMYHHVSLHKSEGLTISLEKLEAQLAYLSEAKYQSYHFKELKKQTQLPEGKHILITFDDAYVSQLELAYPLLKKYGLKATFFVPLGYVGKRDDWNTASLDIMTLEQLQALDPEIIELGFHSFAHKKYDELSSSEIEIDTGSCMDLVTKQQLTVSSVLAYPYGKYPREISNKETFIGQLKKHGLTHGLRIGNRINTFPFLKPFEIQRIDVKGEYSQSQFKWKLRFGKLL